MGMVGSDQTKLGLPVVSSRYAEAVVSSVPKAGRVEVKSVSTAVSTEPPKLHPDPTRYGDWERAGRCVDF